MATQEQSEGQGKAVEVSELDQLLQKEFKPRSDAAKEAVETAVRTLAEQALQQTTVISVGRGGDDRVDHRRARPEAQRADQPDHAPQGLPGAGGRLARARSTW